MAMTLTNELPPEAPIVAPDLTLTSLSEEVSSRVLMDRAPLWWWVGFSISFALFTVLIIQMGWLFIGGIGVWGVNIPVAWGLAIAEYVWWIALASGGTIVSALFFLTRSPWRSATNRIAESMLLSAAPCAGLLPIMHLGRPGLFYWLFPYSNVMGVWPQVRSPLWWDFICLISPPCAIWPRAGSNKYSTAFWRSAGAVPPSSGATSASSTPSCRRSWRRWWSRCTAWSASILPAGSRPVGTTRNSRRISFSAPSSPARR